MNGRRDEVVQYRQVRAPIRAPIGGWQARVPMVAPPPPPPPPPRMREAKSPLACEADAIDAYYTGQELLEDAARDLRTLFFAHQEDWWAHTTWEQRHAIDAFLRRLRDLDMLRQAWNMAKGGGPW